MDFTTIIVTIVTGIFSLFTIILQRKNNKDVEHIEEKGKIIQKKNELLSELTKMKDDANMLYQERNQLILITNIHALKKDISPEQLKEYDDLSKEISNKIKCIHNDINDKRNEFYTLEKVDKYIKHEGNSG